MANVRGLFYFGARAYAEYKEVEFDLTERKFSLTLDELGFGLEEVTLVVETLMKGFEAAPVKGAKKK